MNMPSYVGRNPKPQLHTKNNRQSRTGSGRASVVQCPMLRHFVCFDFHSFAVLCFLFFQLGGYGGGDDLGEAGGVENMMKMPCMKNNKIEGFSNSLLTLCSTFNNFPCMFLCVLLSLITQLHIHIYLITMYAYFAAYTKCKIIHYSHYF